MVKSLHPYYLEQMGIETWVIRKPTAQYTKPWILLDEQDSNALKLFNNMLLSLEILLENVMVVSNLTEDTLQKIQINPPLFILVLGQKAAKFLLNIDQTVNDLRGDIHSYHAVPVLVSYHPSELLKQPNHKKNAWKDLVLFNQKITQVTC